MTDTLISDVVTHRYIYPPRAVTATPRAGLNVLADRGWLAQLKFNDTHIVLDYDGPTFVVAWDRHATVPAYDFAALRADLDALGQKLVLWGGTGRHLLDGGLLHSKHAAIKDTLVIWDVLIKDGTHLLGTTYGERHHDLGWLCVGNGDPDSRYTFKGRGATQDLLANWDRAWEIVAAANEGYEHPVLEGLVIKDPRGRLKHGFTERNNSAWLTRSRVTTGRHKF